MIEAHSNLLWIGNAFDARDPRQLFDREIAAVVDLAYEELPAQLPRQLIYCRFPLLDGAGNEGPILLHALQTVIGFLDSATPTLVACSAGMSRSPTIATFALAAMLKKPPEEIIQQIGKQTTLEVKPNFWTDVQNAFEQCKSQRSSHTN